MGPGQLRDFLTQLRQNADFEQQSSKIAVRRRRIRRQRYVVRIDLLGMKPPVWRRLAVASDLTMDQFHVIIQDAFGWEFAHLHCFGLWSPDRGTYCDQLLTRYDIEYEQKTGLAESDVQLNQVLTKPGSKVSYEYDFGDGWHHMVKLEQVTDWVPGDPLAQCLTGRRACPPEDCGGPYGFEEFLREAAARDWDTEEPQDEWEWQMAEFDPAEFNLEDINDRLQFEADHGFIGQGM